MKTIHVIIEMSVLNGSKIGRIAIHILMTLEGKETIGRGVKGVGRELRDALLHK